MSEESKNPASSQEPTAKESENTSRPAKAVESTAAGSSRPDAGQPPAAQAAQSAASDSQATPAPEADKPEEPKEAAESKAETTAAESAAPVAAKDQGEPALDAKAQKRRRKREKAQRSVRAKAAAGPAAGASAAAAQTDQDMAPSVADGDAAATPVTGAAPDPKAEKRRRKREKAQASAERDNRRGGRRRAGAIAGSTLLVLLAGGAVAAGSLYAPPAPGTALPSAVTSLPAGDTIATCPQVPQLLKGVDGTDPQFAPGAKDVSTTIRTAVVSDLAKRIPGASLGQLGQEQSRQLTERIPEEEASQARGSDDQGLTGRTAAVSDTANLDPLQVLRIQPLGDLPSLGSAVRSYQAKDGDLAGLAAGNCVGAESNWRFTGLQTITGSSSVLQLANPTSTTAQVSIELRGEDGLIDTSTLQEIVLGPGASRAIVLGGYAQGRESVSANIRSLGGKITASVQQSALRGLTPSGVDFVAANAPAANTQVIPGVWIDEKANIDELTRDAAAKTLVPQLHVSATGSQGAGFSVKVLDARGEVAANFGEHLAVASNATSALDLRQLAAGYYTIVVEADEPVTAAVRMVRGKNPKDSSDTAWAASAQALNGNQVVPLSAHGTSTFTLAAPGEAASVSAIVVGKDGKLSDAQQLEVPAGTSRTFKPTDVAENAAAVLFQGDSNAYIAQTLLGSDRSVAWAQMPAANASRDGIVVNVAG